MSDNFSQSHKPVELRLKREEKVLEVDFDTGERFRLPAELLRVESPSAEVQGHGPGQKTIVAGIKMLRNIYQQPGFRHLWDIEMVPGPDVKTDDEILDAARQGGGTVYHCTGTCRMGVDEGAVVAPDLKVHGVDRLRVVDASAVSYTHLTLPTKA